MYYILILVFVTGIYGQSNKIIPCQDVVSLQSDATYWYGFGSVPYKKSRKNKSFEAAKEIALGDLSSKINVKIQSSTNVARSSNLKNNKEKISREFFSEVSTSSSVQINDYEIVSQGRCDSQFYTLIRLNKNDFIEKELQSLLTLLSQVESLNDSDFSSLYDYLSFIEQLNNEIKKNYYSLIDSSYNDKVSSSQQFLKNKYISSLSSLDAVYTYTIPYSKYDKRNNNLEIAFISSSSNLPLINGIIFIESFGKKEKYFFNSNGKILYNLNKRVRSQKSVALDISFDINKLLSNHNLFKSYNSKNPQYNFVISEQPVIIHYDDNFRDIALTEYFFNSIKVKISNSLKVDLEKNVQAPFILKIEASDVVKNFNEITNQYIYILRDVNFSVFDNVTNDLVFRVEKSLLKGVSFQSFDKAVKKLNKDLKKINNEIQNEISNKILVL